MFVNVFSHYNIWVWNVTSFIDSLSPPSKFGSEPPFLAAVILSCFYSAMMDVDSFLQASLI